MSRKGNCYDNAVMESFWSSLKRELDAAPAGPTHCLVGGTLRFTQNGMPVTVPLADVPITMHPGPELVVDYFHQRDVFSAEAFTPEMEPAIPYSLGVMVRNVGRGAARNFRITSAQPQTST